MSSSVCFKRSTILVFVSSSLFLRVPRSSMTHSVRPNVLINVTRILTVLTYLQTLKCLSFHHDCTRISPDFFRIEHETVSFITSDKGEGEYRTRVVLCGHDRAKECGSSSQGKYCCLWSVYYESIKRELKTNLYKYSFWNRFKNTGEREKKFVPSSLF